MSWDTCPHCKKSLMSGSHGEGVCAGDPVPCPKMYEPGEAQQEAREKVEKSHIYLIPDNIFHMAWGACVLSSKYDKARWLVMEDEMMLASTRYLNRQDINGGSAIRECLGRVGNLMREQNGDPKRIEKALAEAEENARGFLGDLCKLQINDPRRTYISYLQCLGWEEVENMRKVLGLPEGTG